MYLVLILSSKNNKTCKMEKETNDKGNDKSSILFQLSPKRIVVNVMRRKEHLINCLMRNELDIEYADRKPYSCSTESIKVCKGIMIFVDICM